MAKRLNRILVVDLEATCWDDKEEQGSMPNEIIEIGYAQINTEDEFQIEQTADRCLVRPTRSSISPFCTELTGITTKEFQRNGRRSPNG